MSELALRRRPMPSAAGQAAWPDAVPEVLRQVYARRGVVGPDDVAYRLAHLAKPTALGGMAVAVARLRQALAQDQRVLVVGDYDCDGATGCAVAVRGLRMLGLARVDHMVPHRQRHGYGLSPALLASLPSMPDLIVTVDNGVASVDGVAAAGAHGIDVIVTDHHLPGPTLPAAVAIVNPNLPGDVFPSKALAGVGVMFYLLLALRAELRATGRFDGQPQPDLACLLDLVALGTVADLVPLDYNNRVLVKAGLRRIRGGKASPGLAALIEASGRAASTLVAEDMAFALAPRLNAAGRLEDMGQGIACLLAESIDAALPLARHLCAVNQDRRQLQDTMVAEAERMAANVGSQTATGVALYDPGWHSGVVGLVAARIKERLYRPVVAFAPADPERPQLLRGSARSIPGFHIRDALADMHARHPGLIDRFGGHAMAAGLTLAREHFTDFAAAFDTAARDRLGEGPHQPVLWSDGELPVGGFTLQAAMALRYGGPWGQAFEAPVFDNAFECLDVRPMGSAHRRLRLRDPRDGTIVDAVMFRVPEDQTFAPRLRAAFELVVNDWQGRQSPRLILRHVQPK